jgi:hypothetical protein
MFSYIAQGKVQHQVVWTHFLVPHKQGTASPQILKETPKNGGIKYESRDSQPDAVVFLFGEDSLIQ